MLPVVVTSCLVLGCSSEEAGVSLALHLAHRPSGASQSGPERIIQRPNGDVVRLTRGHLNVASVEILACPSTAWRKLLEALSPVGTARAHTEGTPTRIGEPHVDDLLRDDAQALTLGTLKPPADRYCRGTVLLEPADADAVGLPASVPMEGNTLWLEGTVEPAGGGAAQPFQLASSSEAEVDAQFLGPAGSPSPVPLTTAGIARTGQVLVRYDRWFDGVDPLAPGAADALVDAIAASLELRAD
jgi:hypothetical protein